MQFPSTEYELFWLAYKGLFLQQCFCDIWLLLELQMGFHSCRCWRTIKFIRKWSVSDSCDMPYHIKYRKIRLQLMLPLKRIYCKHHREANNFTFLSTREGKIEKVPKVHVLNFELSTQLQQHWLHSMHSNWSMVYCFCRLYKLQAMVLKHSAVMPHQKHQQHLLYSHNLTSFIASRVHSGGSCSCLPIKRSIVNQNATH